MSLNHPLSPLPSFSKCFDLTEELCGKLEASAVVASIESSSARSSEPHSGALILRGNRCVLVRSLTRPPQWSGMRVPSAEVLPGETAVEAAVRAASDLCDIDAAGEIVHLPQLAPVAIFGANQTVHVHFFHAKKAAPSGESDTEDPSDLYDWYTFPRALGALRDDASRLMLHTAAFALHAAAAAAQIPVRGGRYFQELTATYKSGRLKVTCYP